MRGVYHQKRASMICENELKNHRDCKKNTGGTAYKFQRKITVETTVQKGIRNFVKLKCECGYSSGDYSMPPGSNYAFCHSIKSNGLSKTKINNFISIWFANEFEK